MGQRLPIDRGVVAGLQLRGLEKKLRFAHRIYSVEEMIGGKSRRDLQNLAIDVDDGDRDTVHPCGAARRITRIDDIQALGCFVDKERYSAGFDLRKSAERTGRVLDVIPVVDVDNEWSGHGTRS